MKKIILLFIFLILISSYLVSSQVVSSDQNFFGSRSGTASFTNYGSSFSSVYGSQASTYWPILNGGNECNMNQDILIQVSPAGCQPAVVRSDLLAEQNVAVFCQLDMLQVNPTIDIKQIRNIRFNGKYPEYVAGVGFHPANAALRTTNQLLGTPLQSNIGYVVVVLKKNPNEKDLPKFFNFTLGASIDYYSGNALGIGTTELFLKETNDAEWEVAKNKQTLFGGKMSVRVGNIENGDSINVELYSGDVKYSEFTLRKNSPQPSSIYLPGSYCQTSLQFSYNNFVSPSAFAKIKVDNDILDVSVGSRFLNNKCLVRNISEENIDVSCGAENFKLHSSIEVLGVNDKVYLINPETLEVGNVEYVIKRIFKNSSGSFYDLGERNVSVSNIRPVNPLEFSDKSYGSYDDYINGAISNYELIFNDFGNEFKDLGDSYGEVALIKAIELAYDYDKKKTASKLINNYLEHYPDGKERNKFVNYLNSLYLTDSSSASQSVRAEDGYHLIKLIDIVGGVKKSSARISWGVDHEIEQGGTKEFGNLGRLTLNRVIDSSTIEVEATCKSNDRSKDYKGVVRFEGSNVVSACGANIIVRNIDFENYVQLRISPVSKSGTITNFTVGIGIEKRAIELTPDKANKKIANLNESIRKWESISNNLGEVVKGLKAACFATAGVLTVKNFFTGLSGEALARRNIMSGEDGWTKFCQNEVNAKNPGGPETMTACYNKYSTDIARDVNAGKSAIEGTNEFTKKIESESMYPSREGPLAGQNFNDSEAKEKLIVELKGSCSNYLDGVDLNAKTDYYSYSQLRDLYYNCQALKNGGSSRGVMVAKNEISKIGGSIKGRLDYEKGLDSLQSSSGSNNPLSGIPVDVQGDSKSITGRYFGGTLSSGNFGLSDSKYNGRPAQVVYYNSQPYLAVLKEESGGTLVADEVHDLKEENGNWVVGAKNEGVKNKFSKFEKRNPSSYNNQFAPGEEEVKYFETEPYKGYPAIVPFDFDKGFYAATTQALPIFGGTKAIESSGNPASFFVCNVMNGGRVDFYAPNYGNDECVQFNVYTGQSFSNFPGLSEGETRKVVGEAVRALKDAASQYGKSSVRIGNKNLKVGRAASLLPGSQCQDYMSPEECKLLFNVCDPVICPSSRCNFGGEYYVSDVVQSGIVGSVLLCLPNYKEDIYVPVCLTGIKAGIDGYLSILKSHQQCLQEAVETGKYVGICDQISSVYLCEFFWRQAAPLAKTVIPKVVEYAYSGGQNNVRGGGEYLTVQSSWQNAQDSANYFTQNYAVNSLQAFNIRSFEEAGTEICRAFVSAKGPKTFETLIEPDSPPQFHAWYSSIEFTDATIPATSQYKVFYHIFAGEDRGVSFNVYLKDPPSNTQYATNQIWPVAGGFVSRGQYATESKDFTAPKGYQQLCVRINDKEECGFKQVSSSFAVNYVRDSVVKNELTRTDVTTEAECISGSANPAAFLNPNLQSGAEEALNPAIYNRGIVRVCATSNPGIGTDESRYVKVGICGSDRLVCWLDKGSLDRAITDSNVGLKDKTLEEVEQIQREQLAEDGKFLDYPGLKNELEGIIKKIDGKGFDSLGIGAVIVELDDLIKRAFWPRDKAEVLFWKATAYEKVFLSSLSKIAKDVKGKVDVKDASRSEDSGDSKSSSSSNSAGSTLKFKEKDSSNKLYILLNGKETKIYLQGQRIFFENSRNVIGSVSDDGKITFTNKETVECALGKDSFSLLNGGVNVIRDIDSDSGLTMNGVGSIPEGSPEICKPSQGVLKIKLNSDSLGFADYSYYYLDGKKSNLYLHMQKKEFYVDLGWDKSVGTFDDRSKVITLKSDALLDINKLFGLGAYEKINGKKYDSLILLSDDASCQDVRDCTRKFGGKDEDYICPSGYCQSKGYDTDKDNIDKVLSFNQEYDARNKVYILVGGRETGIYLQGESVYSDNSPTPIGGISSDGRINFLAGKGSIVDSSFGFIGVYDLFKNKVIDIRVIEAGRFNLDVANTITGEVNQK